MNLFKFEKKAVEPSDDFQAGVDRLRAFRDIGQKFDYLGIEMIVLAHSRWIPTIPIQKEPCIVADYVDANRRIFTVYFRLSMLPVLLAENPET